MPMRSRRKRKASAMEIIALATLILQLVNNLITFVDWLLR